MPCPKAMCGFGSRCRRCSAPDRHSAALPHGAGHRLSPDVRFEPGPNGESRQEQHGAAARARSVLASLPRVASPWAWCRRSLRCARHSERSVAGARRWRVIKPAVADGRRERYPVRFGYSRPATFCAPSTPEVSSLVLPSGPIRPWVADAHGRMSAGPASRSRCCNRVRWRRRRFRRHTSRSGRRRPGSRRCCHPAARSRAHHRTRRRCRLRR